MIAKRGRKKQEKAEKIKDRKIEDIIKDLKADDELINVPKTLLRKEEWGLLTILNLLLAGIFPVYFVKILLISFFTEVGHLWTTHLTEVERKRLMDFEKEFREGYEKEEEKKWREAIKIYESLVPKYKDNSRISKIAADRVEWIEKKYLNKGK